jgi:hypothetical protein
MAKVPVLYNGVPLLNASGVPIVYDDSVYPDGPPPECCCEINNCCGRGTPDSDDPNKFPNTLTLTLTNVSNCACINGQTITLTWDTVQGGWFGTGGALSAGCTIDTANWELTCSDDGVDPGNDCRDYILVMTQPSGGACVTISDFANSGCSCDPLELEFTLNPAGIGCCDSPFGPFEITATVTE